MPPPAYGTLWVSGFLVGGADDDLGRPHDGHVHLHSHQEEECRVGLRAVNLQTSVSLA